MIEVSGDYSSHNYRESLENAITAEKIRSLKELPMIRFEKEIWEALGKRYIISEKDRQLVNIMF